MRFIYMLYINTCMLYLTDIYKIYIEVCKTPNRKEGEKYYRIKERKKKKQTHTIRVSQRV